MGIFYKQLESEKNIDETHFYFADNPDKKEHYLGCLPQYEKPFWVGYCDIENGCEFESAAELVNAPIFDGRTLKERWNQVNICSIEGLAIEDWLKYVKHC